MKLAKQITESPVKAPLHQLTEQFREIEAKIREGGGEKGKERQRRHGRLTARERLNLLLDDDEQFFELGLWAAYNMYEEWGGVPAAGVITGIGKISGRECMVVVNDATVKAGAMFPQSVKKVLRAQRIAYECRLPTIYLVDSSGVFLPLQEEIFPDEDDFGRIFRNNAIFSARGIPQIAAIMGNCIAGGGYLPVLCDTLLMTEGSGLYLAGPALVKAAIGHEVDPEELGGAKMHAEISGTVDFLEPDDISCIERIRHLVDKFSKESETCEDLDVDTARLPHTLYDFIDPEGKRPYDVRDLLAGVIDKGSMDEFKANFGKPIVTAFAKINNVSVGIVASQRILTTSGRGEVEIGGVLYAESADKAARFVMECNQARVPIIFFQDVMGFMVGVQAEQSGIIRSGAKLVNAVSNSIVPKITIIVGSSFGAGNYALCGKAYDPNFVLAWPSAKYSVMGADQAAGTLFTVEKSKAERLGRPLDEESAQKMFEEIQKKYQEHMDIRYGAARGWIDAIIAPHQTREVLIRILSLTARAPLKTEIFHTGVIQV